MGFPLALFFTWAFELTPEGIKPSKDINQAESITHVTGQKLNVTIIGLLAFALLFVVIDNYVLKETPEVREQLSAPPTIAETVAPAPTKVEETATAAPPNSIAVLPFANMSEDKANEYFADGIAEELLNSLARIKDLEVRGRTSSFYFKGRSEDLHTISKMLNVENIIEGSVRKAGEQVRITVQLINTRTDAHLWSETYDRALDDIFAVQENIARSVASALQITLGVGELGRATGMTRNVEAYDAYLAGRSLLYQPGRENVSRAIEQYEQAVALDPDFAIAWAALARVYQPDLAMAFIPERAEEFIAKRDAASARVMAIAPEADYALRIAAEQSGDRVEVERLRKQALALDPAGYESNISYGSFLSSVGRPTEAIDYLQRAIRAEPLVSAAYTVLGLTYEMSGNSAAAMTALKLARDLSNQPAFIG
jgi:TolB-like protein